LNRGRQKSKLAKSASTTRGGEKNAGRRADKGGKIRRDPIEKG
jgi:hypothetical protein